MSIAGLQHEAARKRRWVQYSLRTLLFVMLLGSIGMSRLAVVMRAAGREREAASVLERFPCRIGYDHKLSNPRARSRNSAWLTRWLGGDSYPHVEYVCLASEEFTDTDVARVEHLPRLKVLLLQGTSVTDAGLRHLRGLTQLESLSLDGAKVTDAGLEHLKGLTRLKELELYDTRVTEQGIKKLRQALPNCEVTK